MIGEHEYARLKPQLWAAFATGALANHRNDSSLAAIAADKLIEAFEERFVREAPDDDAA